MIKFTTTNDCFWFSRSNLTFGNHKSYDFKTTNFTYQKLSTKIGETVVREKRENRRKEIRSIVRSILNFWVIIGEKERERGQGVIDCMCAPHCGEHEWSSAKVKQSCLVGRLGGLLTNRKTKVCSSSWPSSSSSTTTKINFLPRKSSFLILGQKKRPIFVFPSNTRIPVGVRPRLYSLPSFPVNKYTQAVSNV